MSESGAIRRYLLPCREAMFISSDTHPVTTFAYSAIGYAHALIPSDTLLSLLCSQVFVLARNARCGTISGNTIYGMGNHVS
ncbi:MAG: hypothetical protein K8F30_03970, partial [Taibaiella sp.]|nr:hypothetical protein [Taibaiella sp.]